MDIRPRILNCVFLNLEDVHKLISDYRRGRFELGGQHGAAVQYYLRHFLYMPYSVIAEVFQRKPWHVKQTIGRMTTLAESTRTPVTMNEDYQLYIERIDDYCRDKYDIGNVELASLTDQKEVDYLLWNAQKATGRFEEHEDQPLQHDIWDEVFSFLGMDYTAEVVYDLCENYTISKNA